MLQKTKVAGTCAPPQCGKREPLHCGCRRGCAARLMPLVPNILLVYALAVRGITGVVGVDLQE
jgi:hypothetical protein